jgi:hypothetical protein
MFRGLYCSRPVASLYSIRWQWRTMAKPDAVSGAARKAMPAGGRSDAPVELVCLALMLALVALALRIAAIW